MPKEKVVSIMQQMADNHQISEEVVKLLIDNYEAVVQQVDENCGRIIHNYEEIRDRYQKISKMFS